MFFECRSHFLGGSTRAESQKKRRGGGDSIRNNITGGAFGQTWDVPSAVTAVFKYVEEG